MSFNQVVSYFGLPEELVEHKFKKIGNYDTVSYFLFLLRIIILVVALTSYNVMRHKNTTEFNFE